MIDLPLVINVPGLKANRAKHDVTCLSIREADKSLFKFQASQSYTVKSCLKVKQTNPSHKNISLPFRDFASLFCFFIT